MSSCDILNVIFVCQITNDCLFTVSAEHSNGLVKLQVTEFPLKIFSWLGCMTSNKPLAFSMLLPVWFE